MNRVCAFDGNPMGIRPTWCSWFVSHRADIYARCICLLVFFRVLCKLQVEAMYKALAIVIIAIIGIANASSRLTSQSHNIQRAKLDFGRTAVGLDVCPTCINVAEQSINILLNLILDSGIIGTCGTLCQALADKTGSQALGAVCDIVCDFLGIDEFIKLLDKADLDPIWYCEIAKLCPGKRKTVKFCVQTKLSPSFSSFRSVQSMTTAMLKSPNSAFYQPLVDKEQHSPLLSPTSHWTVPALVNWWLISVLLTTFHWVTVSWSKRRKLAHTTKKSPWKPNLIHNVIPHNVRSPWCSSAAHSEPGCLLWFLQRSVKTGYPECTMSPFKSATVNADRNTLTLLSTIQPRVHSHLPVKWPCIWCFLWNKQKPSHSRECFSFFQ